MVNKSNETIPFCLAPWVHSHVNMIGQRALCTQAEPFKDRYWEKFEDYWNSEELRKIRKTMLSGTAPPEYCRACLDQQITHDKPKEIFNKIDKFSNLRRTDQDGRFEGLPSFVDYRLSNDCNLSCRMCNAESSSKIETALKKTGFAKSEDLNLIEQKKTLNKTLFEPELKKLIEDGNITKMYWASGEVLIQPSHWKFLEECVRLDQAQNIDLVYNTNLSFPLRNLESNEELLNNFNSVSFKVSLDGTGEIVELIRDGLNWNLFLKNLDWLSKHHKFNLESFSITLSILTMLNIETFLDFLYHYQIPCDVFLCEMIGLSILHSPLSLTKEISSSLIDKAKIKIGSFDDQFLFKNFLKTFELLEGSVEQKPSRKELYFLFKDNSELDEILKRPSLKDLYSSFSELNGWVPLEQEFIFDKKIITEDILEIKDPYWRTVYSGAEKGLVLNHTYHQLNDLNYFLRSTILNGFNLKMSGSYPGLFYKLLNDKKEPKKLKLYNDLVKNKETFLKEYPFVSISKVKHLGPISFLLRNSKFLVLGKMADLLIRPFSGLLSMHLYIELEKNKDYK
ncbi:MAG: hypothetical protein CME70_07290 [Halobacteriovorax sp.]|nr:hypothetical protein [Halobacteriovorax sp.]|tara:strand:+ start:385267 stop:386961 length:1695 start_codon:yes stop_codon:yes gene_type:complete